MLQFPDPLNAQGTYDHRFSPPDKPVSKVLLFPQFADKEKTIQSATMIWHQSTSFPGLSGCVLLHKQYISYKNPDDAYVDWQESVTSEFQLMMFSYLIDI